MIKWFSCMLGAVCLVQAVPAAAAGVNDLAWLAGDWRSEEGGGLTQEVWTLPQAGSMTGMFRLIGGGKVRVLEYVIIAEEAGGVFYQFKHFRTDYSTWEGANPPIRMKLLEAKPGRAVFRNTRDVEGQPTYISYLRDEDGRLSILVGGSPDAPGEYDGMKFMLTRQ